MKLSVIQENLARGLQVVSRAVSSRSTLPVLANVLLRTEDAGLKLTATNLEIGITYWVPGKIETDGAITVPARLLTDLVSCLPGQRARRPRAPAPATAAPPLRPVRDARARASTPRSSRPSPPPASARRPGSPRRCSSGPWARSTFAAATDEARPDPDRRPGPVRGRPADAGRGRQLPDRRHDDRRSSTRSRRRASSSPPARYNELARVLADTDDPVEIILSPSPQPGPVPPRGHRPRQPPDRRPVPQLPAGPARRATRPRVELDRDELLKAVRLAALHRQLVGQHRQAPGRRAKARRQVDGQRRRPTSATTAATSTPTIEGDGDDHRLQRPLPGRRARERRRRPLRASSSTGRSRRASSGRSTARDYTHVVMPVRTTS